MTSITKQVAAFLNPQGWWTGKTPPTFYSFDPDTKEYRSSGLCDPSPLEEGMWLYPVSSAHVAPPDVEEGYVPVWNGKSWEPVRDRRGHLVFAEGEFRHIATLGEHPELTLDVHDAQYLPGGMIRMWDNDAAIDIPDDPKHPARQIVAAWEELGETIRPAEAPVPTSSDAVSEYRNPTRRLRP